MRTSVAVGVRLPDDLVEELDEIAVQQAEAASDAGGVTIKVSRSRTVRELIHLGLTALKERKEGGRDG